jgi:hypothetical protein
LCLRCGGSVLGAGVEGLSMFLSSSVNGGVKGVIMVSCGWQVGNMMLARVE